MKILSNYKRLSVEEREEISRGLAKEVPFSQIAKGLNRHRSTITGGMLILVELQKTGRI